MRRWYARALRPESVIRYHARPRSPWAARITLKFRSSKPGLGETADPKEGYAWSEVATIEGSPFAERDRDASLRELRGADRQIAAARAHEILSDIRRENTER